MLGIYFFEKNYLYHCFSFFIPSINLDFVSFSCACIEKVANVISTMNRDIDFFIEDFYLDVCNLK